MDAHLPGWLWPIALFGVIGAGIDFLIGRAGQERARLFLETWWIRFDDVHWNNFGRKEAEFTVSLVDRWCGRRLFSVRRLVFVLAFFALAFLIGHLIAMLARKAIFLPIKPTVFLWLIIITWFLALATSLSLNRLISAIVVRLSSDSLLKNAVTFTLLLLISYIVLVFWLPITRFLGGMYAWTFLLLDSKEPIAHKDDLYLTVYDPNEEYDPTLWPIAAVTNIYHQFVLGLRSEIPGVGEEEIASYYWLEFAHLSASYVPSIIRIAIAMAFTASFIVQPIVMRPLSLVWRRIVESDKPIFTLILGGIASCYALVSLVAKHV